MTSAEKRRLVAWVRRHSPRGLPPGRTRTLRLTERDIELLLAWGLSLGVSEPKVEVTLTQDTAELSASVGYRWGGRRARYLNFSAAGRADVVDGVMHLRVDRCRLGRADVPYWVLGFVVGQVASELHFDRRVGPLLDAIENIEIAQSTIAITYGPVVLPPGYRQELFGPDGDGEMVLAVTRLQVKQLHALAKRSRQRVPFERYLEEAFMLARVRSAESDPVTENRAAIFALGIVLGHPRIEAFVGSVRDVVDTTNTGLLLTGVTIRNRADWTRHFTVSAVLALLSNEMVSDAAGLLKEELDAGRGGSGFSFADLLADRAGTTFGITATRDATTARAIQDRIAQSVRVDDFFPLAADLPEGLSDTQLQKQYGGVGGKGYRSLIDEIERRVADCQVYR